MLRKEVLIQLVLYMTIFLNIQHNLQTLHNPEAHFHDHDTPLYDAPAVEDMPLCDTPDKLQKIENMLQKKLSERDEFSKYHILYTTLALK